MAERASCAAVLQAFAESAESHIPQGDPSQAVFNPFSKTINRLVFWRAEGSADLYRGGSGGAK
ncbi:hypothetical protein ACUM6F_04005 [Desulforudis sp. DRI-14]